MGTRWEGEEGGMNLEIRFDINTPARVKQIASGKLPYSRGSSAPCSVMTDLGVGNGGGRPKRGNMYICTADSQQKLTTL